MIIYCFVIIHRRKLSWLNVLHAVDGNKIQVQKFANRVGPSMFTNKELYWYHAEGFRSVPSSLIR